jgi:hypothetical protein
VNEKHLAVGGERELPRPVAGKFVELTPHGHVPQTQGVARRGQGAAVRRKATEGGRIILRREGADEIAAGPIPEPDPTGGPVVLILIAGRCQQLAVRRKGDSVDARGGQFVSAQ